MSGLYAIKKYFIIFLLASFIISVQCHAGQKSKKSQVKKKVTTGKVVANYGKYDFNFRTLDGNIIRLSDCAGKVVLVNIWAPWATPCNLETQGLRKLYEKYHSKGFDILGVAVQTNESDVRSFMVKHKVRWQIGIKDDITKAYGSYGIPDSYLFRADGSLVKEFVGFASEEALDPLLNEMFKSSKIKQH